MRRCGLAAVKMQRCSLAEQILDGDISASPAILDAKSTACDYCPYKEACGFDPRIPGYSFRK